MRITLDIADDVLRAAKDLAARENKTAGQVGQVDEAFMAAARLVFQKNAELYRWPAPPMSWTG
jgi:hypothetical protein